ncbi:TPA: hypothetical protein ACPZCO_002519 [Yersinia enterocolitica]
MRFKTDTGEYACFYPQERPIDGTQVKAWDETGKYLGIGVGAHRRECGGVIVVDGKCYDSNHIINWLPVVVEGNADAE